MKIATFATTVICVALCGCTTFNLGNVKPQATRTADQQELDTLSCKDEAHLAANAPGEQTREFLLGFTLIGYPVAVLDDRYVQRKAFTDCMTAKGYTIIPAT